MELEQALSNFYQKVDEKRKQGYTDTDILNGLSKRSKILSDKILKTRDRYGVDDKLKNDRDLVNFMSEKFSGKMPSVESVPQKAVPTVQYNRPIGPEPAPAEDKNIVEKTARFGSDIAQGAKKGVASSFLGLASLPQQAGRALAERITGLPAPKEFKTIREQADKTGMLERKNIGEKIGFGAEQLGELFIPGAYVGRATKATKLAKGSIQGLKAGAKTGAVIGTGQGVLSGIQKDKDIKGITEEALKFGATGGIIGGLAGGISGGLKARINRKKEIAKLLKEKSSDAVKYKKALTGKIIKDKNATKAVSVGIDETDISFIKNSSIRDKQVFQKMYKIAEKSSKNKTITSRPAEKAGEVLLHRIKFLTAKKKTIGSTIGEKIKLMPQKPININNIYDDFVDDITNAGIKIKSKGKLDFRNSNIADSTTTKKQLQNLYNDIRPNTDGDVLRTPQRINTIRQKIFDNLNLSKKTNEVSSNTERIIIKTRLNLGSSLEEINKDYKILNTKYATISDTLNRFNKLMGRDFDIESGISKLRAGEVGNRILGNASAKPLGTIRDVEKLAKNLGYKTTTDVRNQFLFVDFLEDLFGSTQTRSLRGQVGKGVGDAEEAIGIGKSLIKKDPNVLLKGYNLVRGVTPENQKEAVKRLIGL